ncbi:MAG: hypothetical protein AAGD38_12480, partial [Acidobacteriota bacterium]
PGGGPRAGGPPTGVFTGVTPIVSGIDDRVFRLDPTRARLATDLLLPGRGTETPEAAATSEAATESGRIVGTVAPVPIDVKLPNPQRELKIDLENEAGLRNIFEELAGPGREVVTLLDVSSNADQFGVDLVARRDSRQPLELDIDALDLVAPGRNVRAMTTPIVQWEPVRTIQNPDVGPFPPILASRDDGGATRLGADSVTLVPVAPRPVVEQIVAEHASQPAGAMFTLPFGMKAAAMLRRQGGGRTAALTLDRPVSTDGELTGGMQLSMRATGFVGSESPGFDGATYQTRNGVDPVTRAPLGISVLWASANPASSAETIFNNEMGPGGTDPRVPVTRLDISGYGASMFSDWRAPDAGNAETTQVRFDVVVGRTAYEVVQVKTTLYPWGVAVVRTITIERRRGGFVYRRDSGWVAVSDGRFQFVPPPPGEPPIVIHPGVVQAALDVRRIRETGRNVELTVDGVPMVLAEVLFDTDIQMADVVAGHRAGSRVPSRDQVGYLQIEPSGAGLSATQLAAALAAEGSAGGGLDCTLDVAGSGQRMRVGRVEIGIAPQTAGAPQFAGVARGSLALPEDGDWSVIRWASADGQPQPVDRDLGVPLVRRGPVGGGAPDIWYRVADAADLLRPASPENEHALLLASDVHRVAYPRPRMRAGGNGWESTLTARLADAYALMHATSVFPPLDSTFESQGMWRLDLRPGGRYRQGPNPTVSFPVPAGRRESDLTAVSAFRIFRRYDGAPDALRFTLDPDDAKPWRLDMRKMEVAMDLGPFSEVIKVVHDVAAATGTAPQLADPEVVYGSVLAPVTPIIRFMEALGFDPFSLSLSNPKWKLKAGVRINIIDPKKPDGYLDLVGLKVKGKIGAGFGNDSTALTSAVGSPAALPPGTPKDVWTGYLYFVLGAKVPIILPLFGEGEGDVEITGNELTGYGVKVKLLWGASVDASLGPIYVMAKFQWGIQVVVESNAFGLGVLIILTGSASVLIFTITVKIELLGQVKLLLPGGAGSSNEVELLGSAKFAVEITICWFVTLEFSATLSYSEKFKL